MNPRLSTASILHPDPVTLAWVVVAVCIASLSLVRFSNFFESGIPRHTNFPTLSVGKTQRQWLGGILVMWWSLDALWQTHSYVVRPEFWRLAFVHPDYTHLRWIPLTTRLWSQSPAFWAILTIAIDASLVLLLLWFFGRAPRWLFGAMMGWGIIRWTLTGASAAWGDVHVPGPSGYLIAAAMAYLLIVPEHYRYVLTGLSVWCLGDAIAASPAHPILVDALLLAGFAFLAVSAWRSASSLTLRLTAAALAIEVLSLASAYHFRHLDPNQLWVLMLLALSFGRHLRSQTTHVFERLGG